MQLCQLIYFSMKQDLGPGGIESILDRSREQNLKNDVTGVLLFNQDYFLQLLEGSREQVTSTFCRVAADPRHGTVTLISVQDIDERDFPDWNMGYVPSTSPVLNAALRKYSPTGEASPGPEILAAATVIEIMKLMRSVGRLV
jgi:Sensors of blue-light using FAD